MEEGLDLSNLQPVMYLLQRGHTTFWNYASN